MVPPLPTVQDTTTRAFDDPAVMEAYCGLASEGTGTVTDSIVFSHSYGNAAFAAAIQHGYCDIDKNSSSWYEVSGPLRGSKAADWAGYICSHNSTIDEALRMAARLVRQSLSYDAVGWGGGGGVS